MNHSKFSPSEELSVRIAVNDDSITIPELKAKQVCAEGTLTDLCGDLEGKTINEGIVAIIQQLEALDLGSKKSVYKLRDWLISRQRYWGAPIPIIYCDSCGTVPVPEEQLPVLLPDDVKLTGRGRSPLLDHDWINVECP